MKKLGLIPARGGSKGVPKKNLFPINGKPLLAYTIEAALTSQVLTKTIVSSDSEEILSVAKQYGAQGVLRPGDLAKDLTPSEPVIEHAIRYLNNLDEFFDIIVLLQATSPLRDGKDIQRALTLFESSNATSLFSVYEPEHSPYKAFILTDQGYLTGLVDNEAPFKRRQDLPTTYMPNGAIYITYCESFLRTGSLFTEQTIPYVMPARMSLDIDTLQDIDDASKLLEPAKRVQTT